MILIYVIFRDHTRTLWKTIDDTSFDVQEWANKNADNFRLLDIFHIYYEII